MFFQRWSEAIAAKDVDAVMATFHEDILCVNNEQLLTREDVKQATQQTMTGENWIMSDFNVKFEDKHHSVVDCKIVIDGVLYQYRMAVVLKDGLAFRMISYFEPL